MMFGGPPGPRSDRDSEEIVKWGGALRFLAPFLLVVAVLISGRPLIVNAELGLSQAFVAAWLPGSEGKGVAEVLFGDFDFSGRLSFSWPKQNGQQVNTGDLNYEPVFEFGYGLSYTD